MNRCIQCYRCVRFYRDYAGGTDLTTLGWHNHVYFGRFEDGPLESVFAGNLAEVCPTGVFTDKPYAQHYTRKWDLQTAPSVCTGCGLGCNTIPGERYGMLRRIRARYNGQVNGYFLCDRGRYGYEFVNSPDRIRRPMVRSADGKLATVDAAAAMEQVGKLLSRTDRVIGIGSPRASLEANFALRNLVGAERFSNGLAEREWLLVSAVIDILKNSGASTPSLKAVEQADAVLILGENVTQTAPLLALAVRQAARNSAKDFAKSIGIDSWNDAPIRELAQDDHGPVFIASADVTDLDDIATGSLRAADNDIARLGFAIASALDVSVPAVVDLSAPAAALVAKIAAVLKAAKRPLIISGTSSGSMAVVQAAANVARALVAAGTPAGISMVLGECNTMGAGLMGGMTLQQAGKLLHAGQADTVVILENDLYRRLPTTCVDAMLADKNVIVLDLLANRTTDKATVVLPAATFAESDGTLVSSEGRAQRYFKVFVPNNGEISESWRWLRDAVSLAGRMPTGWNIFADVTSALVGALPTFAGVDGIVPPPSFRVAGQKIPRQPHRYSGRTAMTANISVHEPGAAQDKDSPLAFSMEGSLNPPTTLSCNAWAPGWNSCQSINKFQSEIGGPLHDGDGGLRLIEAVKPSGGYFKTVPAAFVARQDEFLITPAWHAFGSEELSVLSPGVAELSPKPYVGVSAADAQALNLIDGQEADVVTADLAMRLPVRVRAALATGVIAVPAGLRGSPFLDAPVRATLHGVAARREK